MASYTMTVVVSAIVLAGLNGLIAVVMGAIGAHGVSDDQAAQWMATGSMFQLAHAAAGIGLAALIAGRKPPVSQLLLPTIVVGLTGGGALIFAGALYATAFGGQWAEFLGWAAPWGGLAMIAGWAVLIVYGVGLFFRRP